MKFSPFWRPDQSSICCFVGIEQPKNDGNERDVLAYLVLSTLDDHYMELVALSTDVLTSDRFEEEYVLVLAGTISAAFKEVDELKALLVVHLAGEDEKRFSFILDQTTEIDLQAENFGSEKEFTEFHTISLNPAEKNTLRVETSQDGGSKLQHVGISVKVDPERWSDFRLFPKVEKLEDIMVSWGRDDGPRFHFQLGAVPKESLDEMRNRVALCHVPRSGLARRSLQRSWSVGSGAITARVASNLRSSEHGRAICLECNVLSPEDGMMEISLTAQPGDILALDVRGDKIKLRTSEDAYAGLETLRHFSDYGLLFRCTTTGLQLVTEQNKTDDPACSVAITSLKEGAAYREMMGQVSLKPSYEITKSHLSPIWRGECAKHLPQDPNLAASAPRLLAAEAIWLNSNILNRISIDNLSLLGLAASARENSEFGTWLSDAAQSTTDLSSLIFEVFTPAQLAELDRLDIKRHVEILFRFSKSPVALLNATENKGRLIFLTYLDDETLVDLAHIFQARHRLAPSARAWVSYFAKMTSRPDTSSIPISIFAPAISEKKASNSPSRRTCEIFCCALNVLEGLVKKNQEKTWVPLRPREVSTLEISKRPNLLFSQGVDLPELREEQPELATYLEAMAQQLMAGFKTEESTAIMEKANGGPERG